MESEGSFRDILNCYCSLMTSNLEDFSNKVKRLRLPIIPKVLLKRLISESKEIFQDEPMCLQVPVPIVVVGDLHGHILDLLRILKVHHLPPVTRYLFLGDFIDRGEFSTEIMIVILTLKVLYPSDVFIIRGNHEFETVVDHSSFFSELYNMYNDNTVGHDFMDLFSYMPLAANAENFALCVHGGIGPSWYFMEQLREIQRPINDCDTPLVSEILWSDPADIAEFEDSHRGLGVHFGKAPIVNFLQRTGFSYLIRGHQCIQSGCEASLGNRVITVFSASNYCGCEKNKSGVLILIPGESYETATYDPFNYLRRNETNFQPLDVMKNDLSPKKKQVKRMLPKPRVFSDAEMAVKSMTSMPRLDPLYTFSPPPKKPIGPMHPAGPRRMSMINPRVADATRSTKKLPGMSPRLYDPSGPIVVPNLPRARRRLSKPEPGSF